MSTYGLDASKILKLTTATPNTLTIFPGGTGDEDIVALDDKNILQLNGARDVLTIFPGGGGNDDTIALDDKSILGLTSGETVLTLFPDSIGTTDAVAIKPDLQASTTAGHMMYREDALGIVKKVEVSAPLTFSRGVLSSAKEHTGKLGIPRVVLPQTLPAAPTLLSTNMTLASRSTVGRNYITRASGATFLPGGDWGDTETTNDLPERLDRFQFLKVQANMTAVGEGAEHDVYVPCYYKLP